MHLDGEVRARLHSTTTAPLIDLSESGALVEVGGPLRPGSQYIFRLPVPDGGELTLRCRVVRCYIYRFEHAGEETVACYRAAVTFTEVSDAERVRLDAHLRTYGASSPEGAPDNFDEELDH